MKVHYAVGFHTEAAQEHPYITFSCSAVRAVISHERTVIKRSPKKEVTVPLAMTAAISQMNLSKPSATYTKPGSKSKYHDG